MRISQEIANQGSEMRTSYQAVRALRRPPLTRKADAIIAAVYAISCAALLVGLNQLGRRSRQPVRIDKKAITLLATHGDGREMLAGIAGNLEQFRGLSRISVAAKSPAMDRFAAELYHALDDANARLHALAKSASA